MRASVTAAWPAFCTTYEGRCTWLYLDTLKLPTTGLGYRVVDLGSMQSLSWLTKDGQAATTEQKANEWKRILGRTDLAPKGGFAYQSVATLHLPDATVDALLLGLTSVFWSVLLKTLPDIEQWPADAQLALIDMAWNLGPNFLGSKWPNFTKTAKASDFTGCAANCLRAVKAPRDYRHRQLFSNAAAVVKLGIDPEVLWDQKVPTAPVVPPVVPPPVTPPEEPTVTAKMKFRGGWTCSCVATSLPAVEKEMIRRGLIKQSIDIFQLGWRNDVGPSAGTHSMGGCTDVAQYSDAQIQCWRDMGWTMQHRTPAQGFSHHAHGFPLGCPHLAPAAKAQASQWAHRQNGLVSRGPISGKWPIDDWKTALRKWQAAEKKRADDAAEAARKKELELPTTADVVKALTTDKNFLAAVGAAAAAAVLHTDGAIVNTFTGNPKNTDVAVDTALEYLGARTKKAEDALTAIQASLAALTARFPEPPPAA